MGFIFWAFSERICLFWKELTVWAETKPCHLTQCDDGIWVQKKEEGRSITKVNQCRIFFMVCMLFAMGSGRKDFPKISRILFYLRKATSNTMK